MIVIELPIEDWQVNVLAAAAARENVSPVDLIREMVDERANLEVASACRRLLERRETLYEIEYRLAELFHR